MPRDFNASRKNDGYGITNKSNGNVGEKILSFRVRDIAFSISPYLFLISQMLKYNHAPWELLPDSTFGYQQLGITSPIVMAMQIFAFFSVLLVALTSYFEHREEIPMWIKAVAAVFNMLCMLWSFVTLQIEGLDSLLYKTGSPLVYFSINALFIGYDRKLVNIMGGVVRSLLFICPLLFFVEFLKVISNMGWIVFGSSAVMAYFIGSFWLAAIYIAISEYNGKSNCVIVFLLCLLLLIMAVLMRSRSWVLQCVSLVTLFSLISSKDALGRIVKTSALFAVFGVSIYLLIEFFPDYFYALIDKIGEDNRSEQLSTVFAQVPLVTWLVGGGVNAQYFFNGYMTGAIDNQFLYVSYHWGVLFSLLFFLPLLVAMFESYALVARKRSDCIFLAAVLTFWFLAIMGLSIYNTITFNTQTLFIPILIGLTLKTTCELDR